MADGKRIIDLNEAAALTSDMNFAVDSEDGTKKLPVSKLIDSTLTEEGMAAGAKAVGDAITAEATARQTAESNLQTAIAAKADTSALTAETEAREEAITDLKADLSELYIPSDNIYNQATDRHGIKIDDYGVITEDATYKASDYIYVGAGKKVTINVVNGIDRFFYYTTNDASGFSRALWATEEGAKTLELRPTEQYIVILMHEECPDYMVNLGDRLLPYAPYGGEVGPFLRGKINTINNNIEAINNIISKSVTFAVAAGSAHSSTIDKLPYNINAGETYGVFVKSNVSRTVELYEYNGGTNVSKGLIATNTFYTITSSEGATELSLYVSSTSTDAVFSLIAYRNNSLDEVMSDFARNFDVSDVGSRTVDFTVNAGSTHSSLSHQIELAVAKDEYFYCVATGVQGRNTGVFVINDSTAINVGSIADGIVARFKAPIDIEKMGLYLGSGTESASVTFTSFAEKSVLSKLTEKVKYDNQYLVKLLNAKRKANPGYYTSQTSPEIFTLAHFSDIHGNIWAMKKIQEFKDTYKDYLDDVICTGDIVSDKISDGTDFWSSNSDGEILACIGNHDSLGSDGWANPVSQQILYATYIEPYEEKWEAEIVSGHSYWYKDYTDKKIRLIAVDATIYDATEQASQMAWLNEALNGAATNGYAVVGAIHFPPMPADFKKIDSNFTALLHGTAGDMSAFAWHTYHTEILTAVGQFIDNGGDFVCWLSGHTHYDLVSYDDRFPKQLFVTISCAMPSSLCEERIRDDDSGLVLNTVCIDTVRKYVKLIRYGAEWDDCLRHTGTCVIKYDANPPKVLFSN